MRKMTTILVLVLLSSTVFASGSIDACREYTSSLDSMQKSLEARGASETNKAFLMSQYQLTLSDLKDSCLGNDIKAEQLSSCDSLAQINEKVDARMNAGTISKTNAEFLKNQIKISADSLNCK